MLMPKNHSGKIPAAPAPEQDKKTISQQLRDMVKSRKIKYGDDKLLTMKSVTYLKNYFNADGVTHNGRSQPSHTSDHAGKMTDIQMVDSLIRKPTNGARQKESCTQFANERQQWTAAIDLMTHHSKKWMNEHQTEKNGTGFQYMHQSQILQESINSDPSMRVKGYALAGGFICKCDTGSFISMATTRDSNNDMGFSIHTIYPGIAYEPGADNENDSTQRTKVAGITEKRRQYMDLTCDDFTDIVRQTETFKNADKIERSRMLIQARPDLFYGKGTFNGTDLTSQNTSVTRTYTIGEDKKAFCTYYADKTSDDHVYKIFASEDDVYVKRYKRDETSADGYTQVGIVTNNGNEVKTVGLSKGTLRNIETSNPELHKIVNTINEYIHERPITSPAVQAQRTATVDTDLNIDTMPTAEEKAYTTLLA